MPETLAQQAAAANIGTADEIRRNGTPTGEYVITIDVRPILSITELDLGIGRDIGSLADGTAINLDDVPFQARIKGNTIDVWEPGEGCPWTKRQILAAIRTHIRNAVKEA